MSNGDVDEDCVVVGGHIVEAGASIKGRNTPNTGRGKEMAIGRIVAP